MSRSRDDAQDIAEGLQQSHARLSRMMRQGRSFSGKERNCVFLNTGAHPAAAPAADARFATISAVSGLDFPDDGRSVAPVDWDHDGDLDLWISNRNAPRLRLMRNDLPDGSHFIAFRLVGNGTTTNRDGIGSRVEVVINQQGAEKLIQTLRAGEGFLTQSGKWLHFGLGKNDRIETVRVHWPGGQTQVFDGVQTDRYYELVQGQSRPLRWRRPSPEPLLNASSQQLPRPSLGGRIPLLTLLPKPRIHYLDFENTGRILHTGRGRPVLVTLWASWCPHCRAELKEFTRREIAIRGAGVGLLALSVDGLGDQRSSIDNAKKVLADLNFPFASGLALPDLVQDLQKLHDLVIPLEHPLPVPVSFLFDEVGRLAVIYKGTMSVDTMIKDLKHSRGTRADRLQSAAPVVGRPIRHPLIEHASEGNAVRTLFYLGTAMEDKGRLDDAVQYYREILAIRPDSVKTHFNLGQTYAKRRNLEPALDHLSRSVQIQPDFVDGHRALGKLLLKSGRIGPAAGHFEDVLRLNPDDLEALANLGVILAGQGQVPQALDLFERAIRINPNYVPARYNLGAVLLSLNKLERAENEFRQVIRIDAYYPDAHYYLGLVADKKGNLDEAAAYYEREIRVNPDSAKAYNNLGSVFERQGYPARAVAYYRQAIRLRPEFEAARRNLERVQSRHSDID